MSTNACTSLGGTLGTKTGAQCLEAVTVLYILAKEGQEFDSVDDFGNKTKWETLVQDETVVPLFELYEFANANTDATFYESRNFKKQTSKATKVFEAEVYLSLCAHGLLKSFEGSGYTRLYEVTEDGYIIGVMQPGGKVKGQRIKDFNVGIRNNATVDKVPNTKITVVFQDYEELEKNPVMVEPNFDPLLDLEGVAQVKVVILDNVTATGFTAAIYNSCSGEPIYGLQKTDAVIRQSDGSEVAITGLDPVTGTNKYTISTGGLSGDICFGLKGVYTDTNGDLYKSNFDCVTI